MFDPQLDAIGEEAARLGDVVVPHRDFVCVRLPLSASVRVYRGGIGFRMVGRIGFLGREAATALTLAASGAALVGAIAADSIEGTIVAGFAGIVATCYNAAALVITELAIGRLQELIARRMPAALPEGREGGGALPPGAVDRELRPASHAGVGRER